MCVCVCVPHEGPAVVVPVDGAVAELWGSLTPQVTEERLWEGRRVRHCLMCHIWPAILFSSYIEALFRVKYAMN